MPNRRLHRLITVLIPLVFTLCLPALLHAEDRIEWTAVDGADHYVIEIHQSDRLILKTLSNESWLPLFLPPGDYEFKVQAINAFGKVAQESASSTLRIIEPPTPFIIDILPRSIHEGEEPQFRVRVSGFVDAGAEKDPTVFHLENLEGKNIPLLIREAGNNESDSENVSSDSAETATGELPAGKGPVWREVNLEFEKKNPDLGSWNLVMTNPDGRTSRMEDALTVEDRLRPRIKGVRPDALPGGAVHTPATLEIAGLEEGAVISVDGPSPLQATLLNRPKPGILEYSLNLQSVTPGWYSIHVKNPSGGEDFKEKAFEVLPRRLNEEELQAANALKVDERPSRPLPRHPHSIVLGWNASIPFGETTEFYTPDYLGLSLGFAQAFHNDLFRKIPGLNGLGWDFTILYTRHHTTFPLEEIILSRYHFLLGLHYVTPFKFPVNLLLRTSSGIGFSTYSSPERDRDEEFAGITLRDLDSLDYVMRFGAGLRFSIGKRWYIDTSCDFSATFYLSRTAWSVQPCLEGGWRW